MHSFFLVKLFFLNQGLDLNKLFPFDQTLDLVKNLLLEVRSLFQMKLLYFNQTVGFRQSLAGVSKSQTPSFYEKLVLLKAHSFLLNSESFV